MNSWNNCSCMYTICQHSPFYSLWLSRGLLIQHPLIWAAQSEALIKLSYLALFAMCKWPAMCDSAATFQSVFSWFDQLLSIRVHSLTRCVFVLNWAEQTCICRSLSGVSLIATDWVQSVKIRDSQQCTDLQTGKTHGSWWVTHTLQSRKTVLGFAMRWNPFQRLYCQVWVIFA